ncbi:MAG TPA: FHA domain-containing protein, partial [Allocoleopsis sp.]
QNPVAETFVLPPEQAAALSAAKARLPNQAKPPSSLPPTTLAPDVTDAATARLVNCISGAAIPLASNPFTIGRELDNTLVSTDDLCSRHHARIEQIKDSQHNVVYQLTDIGSSNGTYINAQRLNPHQPTPLAPGDRLKIGTEEWIFEV